MHMEEHICPVCGMNAKDSKAHVEHLGIEYYFCTAQCRENFIARPRLYLGKQSAKYTARKIIKRRSFSLDQGVEAEMQMQLIQTMQQVMGVRDANVQGCEIIITYDLLETTAEQIARALADAGFALGSGWAARLKRGWMNYTEKNELDNLTAGESACCNKPPAKG